MQGLPFCVAGMGDLLALFRCISCRFAFGTNVARPTSLGALGRVYTSSEVGWVAAGCDAAADARLLAAGWQPLSGLIGMLDGTAALRAVCMP